jgi:hypothetical protein
MGKLFQLDEDCKALQNIIEKKDREIGQYKIEGCKLKRHLVSTEKFDAIKFEASRPKKFVDLLSRNEKLKDIVRRKEAPWTVLIKEEPQESSSSKTIHNPTKKVKTERPRVAKRRGDFEAISDFDQLIGTSNASGSQGSKKIRTELNL